MKNQVVSMHQDKPRPKKVIFRRKSFAINVLRTIGIAGIVLIAASNPFFGLNIAKGVIKHYKKKKWRDYYKTMHYLDKRGFVKILGEAKGGQIKVEITKNGESVLKTCQIDELELDKSKIWDGKWRIVVFDVPVYKNKFRTAFTEKLKQLGFILVQKSVWACPYECDEQIMILRKFYEIERFVTIIKSDDIEDDHVWRRKFNIQEFRKN